MLNLHSGSHCKVIVGTANLLINVGVNEINSRLPLATTKILYSCSTSPLAPFTVFFANVWRNMHGKYLSLETCNH